MHPKHPKKEVNEALDYAGERDIEVEKTPSGHKWGRLKCTCGRMFSVWSTPRSPFNHGRQIRRWVDQHEHGADEEGQ